MDQKSGNMIPPEPPRLRRTLWWIFFIAIVIYLIPAPFGRGHFLLTKSGADSWNDQARIATVESLAERGTLAIDYSKWGWFTGDKVLLREHFYSTKPPSLSALGAVNYMVLRSAVKTVTGAELTYKNNEDLIYPWVTFTTSVLAFALLLVYFFRALHLVPLSKSMRWLIFWSLAIGSLYPAYSTVFNNHTVAGALTFVAFFYVLRYRLGGAVKWWEAIWAGLAVGFAGVNDLTGSLPFAALFFVLIASHEITSSPQSVKPSAQSGWISITLLASAGIAGTIYLIGKGTIAALLLAPSALAVIAALYTASKRRYFSLLYITGIAIPILAHLFLNSRITGNWMPTYIQSDVYIAVPAGFFGEVLRPEQATIFNPARWRYIAVALFGSRGVFLYTPAILVGLIAAISAAFKKGSELRMEALMLILGVLVGWGYVLMFASANYGGTSFGYRYAIAATPMLIFFGYRFLREQGPKYWKVIYRNLVLWGAIVGLIAIPFPWGMAGFLPRTECSIVESLQYIIYSIFINSAT